MSSGVETQTCAALRQEIERSLRRAFDPADVLPRLARLARLAPAASDDGVFAHRQLAELLVERHPWRAAIHARRALAYRDDDDRAWAVLAFCQTLLGNFRCAATAYQQAIASAPSNPWYAHNLGHLLDVALGSPKRALPWLRSAYQKQEGNSEIVASYVHALARTGSIASARAVLERALLRFESRELEALLRWLDQGAPTSTKRRGVPRVSDSSATAPAQVGPRPAQDRRLVRALERGLCHLPLDGRQRACALLLARDVMDASRGTRKDRSAKARLVVGATVRSEAPVAPPSGARASSARLKRRADDVADLAAAVAYAIVYVDHVPLSQAEVAAPFRVAVGRLRGRFAELRAKLDIIPGDARYATSGART